MEGMTCPFMRYNISGKGRGVRKQAEPKRNYGSGLEPKCAAPRSGVGGCIGEGQERKYRLSSGSCGQPT